VSALTDDRFLNGRVIARQPARGFRSGLDAVMLAAAVPARESSDVLELGAGAGVASLCLAVRVGCTITGVEIDPALAALANENAQANGLNESVHFLEDDVFALRSSLRRTFDHVLCNPPFHDESGKPSPDAGKARATRDKKRLRDWLEAGLKRTRERGTFTAIVRADRLREVISELPQRGVLVYPLWPHGVEPAKRVIVQARKGSRVQSLMLPGLVLHEDDGRYTAHADAVLRDGKALDLG
jgi:tRNA1Val (adenine37-N6)-methyltransferase